MTKKKTPAFSAGMLDQLHNGQNPAMVLRPDDLIGELKKRWPQLDGWSGTRTGS